MDTDFKAVKDIKPDQTILKISGYVNEHAKFPQIENTPKIRVDLKDVIGLNSIGTRSWLVWIKILPDVPITVANAPTLFAKMFGEVRGTLAKKITIESFFIPYYLEETGERQDVLYVRGQQFDDEGTVTHPEVKDAKGRALELDVMPNFFNFLKTNLK